MNNLFLLLVAFLLSQIPIQNNPQKVFDVHLHGTENIEDQLAALVQAGVYKAAISTSWELQEKYRDRPRLSFLRGLMFPCPNGKVPYSLQACFQDGNDWPSPSWVEEQIKVGKIDFFGEILSQYYGIPSADSLLTPYYSLAEKYGLPVGIHTGGAGPDHGSPNFALEYGNPIYLSSVLARFPKLKVWIMHGGDQYYKEAISVMKEYNGVYMDISVLSNPAIVSPDRFATIMKAFLEAGLEDRIMFGTDNGNVREVISAVEELGFLSKAQKDKIFYLNGEAFFSLE